MHATAKTESWQITYGVSEGCESQVFDAMYLVFDYVSPVLAEVPMRFQLRFQVRFPISCLCHSDALDTWTDSLESLGYACLKCEILQFG